MFHLKKFVSGSEFSYTDVQFIDDEAEMATLGIPIIIGDGDRLKQLVIITDFNEVKILSNYSFGIAEVRKIKLKAGHGYTEYRRLNVNGNISFSHVTIIPVSDYGEYNIPTITNEQVAFESDGSLYITNEYNISEITMWP
jgi:hypothetical protein